jgi:menaquinone-dependent protoporphyrinogen oxidase
MKVLVSAASRHGATAEIAERIGEVLQRRLSRAGGEVVVLAPERVAHLERFDAFVLGSAVYRGHWMPSAREMVENNHLVIADRLAWLFSSGPIGDPPRPDEHRVDVSAVVHATRPREHRVFAGRLDRPLLGFGERAIAVAFRAPEGDFRDWIAIDSWATEIADALSMVPS